MCTTPIRSVIRNSAARFVFSFFILSWLAANTDGLAQDDSWQRTSGPYGGGIGALAINDSGHIFAGTGSGVFRSTNNGNSWAAVNNGLTNTGVGPLAINPATRDIFAGTGGGGVFRSTNNGDSWTAVNSGLTDLDVLALAINASGDIFAGTFRGRVFRSTNNGDSWTVVNSGLTNLAVKSLAINPATRHIFAGTDGDGVFRSTDNGNSWTAVNTGLTNTAVGPLAINPATQDIFAGTVGGGVFRSTNNGGSWTNTGLTGLDLTALAINASGDIFAGTFGSGVFRSTNNGNSWDAVNTDLTNSFITALAINASGDIFAGTFGSGVFRSTNNAASWAEVNTGLIASSVYALAINDSGHIFAGTDGGGVFRSTNNGDSWTAVNTGLTNTLVLDLAINPATRDIFAGTGSGGVYRSINNGDNWIEVNTGATNTDVNTLAINSSGDIFAGTTRAYCSGSGRGVFQSTNNGSSWNKVNSGLTDTMDVFALAINDSGHIFAGSARAFCSDRGRGVFRSTNNGVSWTPINSGLMALDVFALAINDSGHIFAGTAGTDSGGVFRSTNNGDNWTRVNAGLTKTTVDALAINASGHIFAGTFGDGVFSSANNGASWTAVNTGLTNTAVVALAINPATRDIFAGTFGGGVFRRMASTTGPTVTTNVATSVTATSATLNGMVNPNNLSTTVKFEYGTTTSYGATIPAMPSPVAGVSPISVSAALTGLSPNTLYHFRVVGTNSAGTTNGVDQTFTTLLPTYPPTLPISTTVNYPSLPNASSYKAMDYRIVGLPGKSDLLVNQLLSGTQNKDWQVYWDNGAASDFFVEFNGSSTFQFSAGRAFWIINKGPVNINTTVPSAPLNAAQEIELPLRTGWNLITNPLTTPIAWSKIQTANSLSDSIYAYNGISGFRTSPNFEPYIGYYYFESRTNPSPLKIPYALYFSSTSAANVDPAIWRVNISLSSSEFNDKSTSFGIAPETSRDLDRLDFRKPRAIAAMPSVEFRRPEWDANYSTFATDIRPEIEESESWGFSVSAIPRQLAQLAFSGIKRIPEHFEVYLIDEGRAQSVNLREDSLYHFTPAAELMKFKVVVGRKENVQEHLSALALPKTFTLEQNYPNPLQASAFNPSTTISVVVPLASEIELKVYDLLGKEVKTLYNGILAAGRHWFSWDGRNAAGSNVVTGVYLYRLNTNSEVSLLGKMILIR